MDGHEMRHRRLCARWTQEELADRTGLSVKTISRMEKTQPSVLMAEYFDHHGA